MHTGSNARCGNQRCPTARNGGSWFPRMVALGPMSHRRSTRSAARIVPHQPLHRALRAAGPGTQPFARRVGGRRFVQEYRGPGPRIACLVPGLGRAADRRRELHEPTPAVTGPVRRHGRHVVGRAPAADALSRPALVPGRRGLYRKARGHAATLRPGPLAAISNSGSLPRPRGLSALARPTDRPYWPRTERSRRPGQSGRRRDENCAR